VYRKKWVIHIDRLHREKANGATVSIGLNPSKVEVTKLHLLKDRKAILARKNRDQSDAGKVCPVLGSPMGQAFCDSIAFGVSDVECLSFVNPFFSCLIVLCVLLI
jgi:hypothetical protein